MLSVFYVLLFLSDFKSARYVPRIRQNTFIEPIDIIKVQVQYNVRDKSKMAETEIVTDPLGAQMTRDHYRSPFYSFGGKRARMCNVQLHALNNTYW